MIKVVADDRERDSGVITALRTEPEVELEIRRLPVGDYLVDDRYVFERKTLRDFAISIFDGRIFRQSSALLYSEFQPIMILEGGSEQLREMKVRRSAIQGAMIHLSINSGIPILRALDGAESAKLMLQVARQRQNIQSSNAVRFGNRPKGKRRSQLLMLQGIPGIGKKKAVTLLAKFGSIENTVNASYEDLCSVDGIGEKLADKIRFIVSESKGTYSATNLT